MRQAVRPRERVAGMIILGNEAADRNAREVVEQRKHRIPDLAADILEIDVYALRAGRGKLRGKVRRLMIDDRVEPQFVAHARAFVRPSHRSEEHTSELQSLMRISYAALRFKH